MNIGILTSWRTQCGIAQYSAHLACALERAGHGTLVLGSRNYDERALPKEDFPEPIGELPVFDVELWNRYGKHGLDVDMILGVHLDVLHVQYEVVLYNRQRLQELLDRFEGVSAITYHDSCIPPDMPGPFDLQFRHRENVGPSGTVIPFGVEIYSPLVRTFGLGRTREDIIRPICGKHGWRYESAATSEAALGGQHWKTQTELHEWLRGADLIVCWYPEVEMAGSSQAARTALATRRPLIVNDTRWFADLPERTTNFAKVPDDPTALEAEMVRTLDSPYLAESSWDRVAQLHHDAYAFAMESQRVREAA
jgi:hypothetical protein